MKNILIIEMSHIMNFHSENTTLENLTLGDINIGLHTISLLHLFIIYDTMNDKFRVIKSRNPDYHNKIFKHINKLDVIIEKIKDVF